MVLAVILLETALTGCWVCCNLGWRVPGQAERCDCCSQGAAGLKGCCSILVICIFCLVISSYDAGKGRPDSFFSEVGTCAYNLDCSEDRRVWLISCRGRYTCQAG